MTYNPGDMSYSSDNAIIAFFTAKGFNVQEDKNTKEIKCSRKIPDHPEGKTENYVFKPSSVSLERRNMESTFSEFGMTIDHKT